jgi:hypothetical protein
VRRLQRGAGRQPDTAALSWRPSVAKVLRWMPLSREGTA